MSASAAPGDLVIVACRPLPDAQAALGVLVLAM
jgi:hypothetical protein